MYLYLHDRLGSVRLVIDDTGTTKNSYTYNAFGESFDTETAENVSNPFKFTGQFFDNEISQYYLRARQYDPALMRFTARDTHERDFTQPGTLHRYLYCINSPTYYVDLNGEFPSLTELSLSIGYGFLIGAHGGFWYGLAHESISHVLEDREFDWGNVGKDTLSFGAFGAILAGGAAVKVGGMIAMPLFHDLAWTMIAGEITGTIFVDKDELEETDEGEKKSKASLEYILLRNMEMQAGTILLEESI